MPKTAPKTSPKIAKKPTLAASQKAKARQKSPEVTDKKQDTSMFEIRSSKKRGSTSTSEERSGGESTTTLERVKRFESFRSTQNTPDVTPTAPQKPQHSPQVQPKPTRAASLPQHDAHRTDTPPMLTSRVHERSNSETMTSEDSTLRPSQLFSARKPRVQRDLQTHDATRHDDVDSDVSMTASFKDRRKLFESVPTMSVADSTTSAARAVARPRHYWLLLSRRRSLRPTLKK